MSSEGTDYSIKPSARVRSMHPKKFGMWLFIITVIMIFASLTSAYIVKKGAGNWKYFELPELFKYTSIIIVISSVSMHWAYISAKRNLLKQFRIGSIITGLLAIAFIYGQIFSWNELIAQNGHFVGNAAGSFIYVFTGLHVLHLVGGIVFLSIVLVSALKNDIDTKRMTRIEMCTTYWHFLGGLWLYFYIFLTVYN